MIDYTGNCGNTSAAVGPFALLRGLIKPTERITKVRIYNTNTKKIILGSSKSETANSSARQILASMARPAAARRSYSISSAPTAVREEVKFPTLGTLKVSMVDAANPFVFVRAKDLGLKGNENMDEFGNNEAPLKKCEEIRSVIAQIMGIAKAAEATQMSPDVPKIAVVAESAPYVTPKGKVETS